jgi:hypothetical protein
MAPQQETFQNDTTFQCLLSSQRALLNRLNSERQRKNALYVINEPAFHGDWPNAAPNQSIGFETSRLDNVAMPKRMSVGIGADCFIMPDPNFDTEQFAATFYDEDKKRPRNGNEDFMKKKRRTTLIFLDYIFCVNEKSMNKKRRTTESFLDHVYENNGEPKTSTVIEPEKVKNRVEYVDSDDDDYGVIVEDVSDDSESDWEVEDEWEFDGNDDDDCKPKMAPEEAKKHLVVFEGATGRTQDSQQRIHDWDQKMGLKRSHSKTMRLSSRSRKELRQFTQKDIKHIIHVSNVN